MTTVTLYKDPDPTPTTPSKSYDSSTIDPSMKTEMSNLSKAHMEFIDWNDQVSSIQISGGEATFYGNIYYNNTTNLKGPPSEAEFLLQNWQKTLKEGDYGLIPDPDPRHFLDTVGMWNDQISSVMVPAGVTVKLYKDPFFGGEPLVLSKDDPDLRNDLIDVSWDNQASAIKVSGGSVTVYDFPTSAPVGSPFMKPFPDTGGKVVNLDSTWDNRISAISFPLAR